MKYSEERPTPNAQRPTPKGDDDAGKMGQAKAKPYDLEERLLEFSARIIQLVDKLPSTRPGNHVASQLLRSGTSPLPNHGEAEAAESRNDFIHKLKICLKELRETRRWLLLVQRVPLIDPPAKVDELLGETDELIRIFFSSLRTANSRSETTSKVREGAEPEDTWALGVERWAFDVQPPAGPSAPEEAP